MGAARHGPLQRSILAALAAGPCTPADLHTQILKEHPDTRIDNMTRAVAKLQAQGLLYWLPMTKEWALAADAPAIAADSVPVPMARMTRCYTALARAMLLLADGVPLTAHEIFPPRTINSAFVVHMLDKLQQLGLIVLAPGSRFQVKDAAAFKKAWADERVFCSIGGFRCTDAQVKNMHLLLSSNGSLREEAAAAAALAGAIGQENVSRRTGLTVPMLADLRAVAALPPEVQEAMEQRDMPPSWARGLPSGLTADEMLEAIESVLDPAEVTEPTPDADAPSDTAILETCMKLCVFIADRVSEIDKRMTFLAKELGYNGSKDGNAG